MRVILAVLSFTLASSFVFAEDQAVTTAELARHLGISTWRIPKGKLPSAYKVSLQDVKNGRLTREYLVGSFKNNGDLLICTRWLSESVSISIDDGTTIISTKAVLPSQPVFTIGNQFTEVGAPLLICYVDREASKIIERHRPIVEADTKKDYIHTENGLAVVITAWNP